MQHNSMKVLLLQDTLNYAGTEAHVLTLARNLATLPNLRVTVGVTVKGELQDRCDYNDVPYRVLPKNPGMLNVLGICAVYSILRNGDADIVHAHNGRTALVAVCATLLSCKGKVVVTQHFIEPDYVHRTGVMGWLAHIVHHFVLAHVDQHICISNVVKAAFISRSRYRIGQRNEVHVIPNGIDDIYSTLNRTDCRGRVSAELLLRSDTRLIVCVARLDPEKAIDALLRSMVHVKGEKSFHCVIVGEGTERCRLEQLARDLDVQNRTTFWGFRDDVSTILRAADIFVLPAPAEPFGLVVVEAMMACLPVVAANNGGPAEIVENGKTGLLVTANDIEGFANAISILIADDSLCEEMGIAGRSRAETYYSSLTMAKNTNDIYGLCGTVGR